MATYNGEKYLHQQIDSILKQTFEDWKLIIHDDGSFDLTTTIIEEYVRNHPNKIIFINDDLFFGNPTQNFYHLLKLSEAPYIMLCDQDDIWMPDKLKTMIRHLKTNDLVLSDNQIIDENGQKLHNSFFALNHSKAGKFHNIIKNSYIGCCMAFNRKILLKSLPFPTDIPMHDWWIGMVAESCGKPCFIPEPLVLYRRHNSNASESGGKSHFNFLKKFQFRYILIKNLIKRCFFNG